MVLLLVVVYCYSGSLLRAVSTFTLTTLVLVLFYRTFLFLNELVRKTNWYHNQFLDSERFVTNSGYRDDLRRNYDIVNLGSNPAKFAFQYQDLIGFNWSTGTQSLETDFKILKNYFSYLKEGGTVLIPLLPFSSCFADNLIKDPSHYAKLYTILDPKLIDNYSSTFVLRYITYPLLSNPLRALYAIFNDVPRDNRLEISVQLLGKRELEKDAQFWMDLWKEEFHLKDLNAPLDKPNAVRQQHNIYVLKYMIKFCLERELKPVLIIPPMTKALSSKFSETFKENHIHSFVREANYKNIPFLNYMDDEQLSNPDLYFNSFFLNANGRKLFTKRVLNDLK